MHVVEPSRKQIRKAASALRHWWTSPEEDGEISHDLIDAWKVVSDFRAGFQRPLDKVTIQLRRFVSYEVDEVIVAQRLKRMPTILDKLERHPSMDVTRMQDIGGCRAVLPSAREVDRVLGRIGRHWDVARVDDYVSNPKPSGYRAIHAVVMRDAHLIEIQLRTPAQQQWAVAVERVGARLGAAVKDGRGPREVLEFFELLSRAIGLDAAGETVDDVLVARIETLGPLIRAILARKR